jgi:hypothetical protein
MQKNITQLEKVVDEKKYLFLCDNDSPLTVVKAVLQEFHSYCEILEKAIIEERQKQEETVEEE